MYIFCYGGEEATSGRKLSPIAPIAGSVKLAVALQLNLYIFVHFLSQQTFYVLLLLILLTFVDHSRAFTKWSCFHRM